jgi:hypothetical protein
MQHRRHDPFVKAVNHADGETGLRVVHRLNATQVTYC